MAHLQVPCGCQPFWPLSLKQASCSCRVSIRTQPTSCWQAVPPGSGDRPTVADGRRESGKTLRQTTHRPEQPCAGMTTLHRTSLRLVMCQRARFSRPVAAEPGKQVRFFCNVGGSGHLRLSRVDVPGDPGHSRSTPGDLRSDRLATPDPGILPSSRWRYRSSISPPGADVSISMNSISLS